MITVAHFSSAGKLGLSTLNCSQIKYTCEWAPLQPLATATAHRGQQLTSTSLMHFPNFTEFPTQWHIIILIFVRRQVWISTNWRRSCATNYTDDYDWIGLWWIVELDTCSSGDLWLSHGASNDYPNINIIARRRHGPNSSRRHNSWCGEGSVLSVDWGEAMSRQLWMRQFGIYDTDGTGVQRGPGIRNNTGKNFPLWESKIIILRC